MDKGLCLLDVLIALMVIVLIQIILRPTQLITRINCNTAALATLAQFKNAQLYAVATDSDVIFTQQNNTVLIDSEQSNLEKVSFLSSIKVHINRVSGLGLKPNLNTKYAGTLTLNCKDQVKKISFPVGLAVLKIK